MLSFSDSKKKRQDQGALRLKEQRAKCKMHRYFRSPTLSLMNCRTNTATTCVLSRLLYLMGLSLLHMSRVDVLILIIPPLKLCKCVDTVLRIEKDRLYGLNAMEVHRAKKFLFKHPSFMIVLSSMVSS